MMGPITRNETRWQSGREQYRGAADVFQSQQEMCEIVLFQGLVMPILQRDEYTPHPAESRFAFSSGIFRYRIQKISPLERGRI